MEDIVVSPLLGLLCVPIHPRFTSHHLPQIFVKPGDRFSALGDFVGDILCHGSLNACFKPCQKIVD